MPPRFHVPNSPGATPWCPGLVLDLPPEAARHVQVLRLQPGSTLLLFNGQGGQWKACVQTMTRQGVQVELQAHESVELELPLQVVLAVCMPANDRMDTLVEKATELGAAGIVPLMSERSVLRLQGERAQRKQAHWQSVAIAACEQCGRNRVPEVHEVQTLKSFMDAFAGTHSSYGRASQSHADARWMLSLAPDAQTLAQLARQGSPSFTSGAKLCLLSGPEGGLTPAEQSLAQSLGFVPVSLGARILRADTAPLAAIAAVSALI